MHKVVSYFSRILQFESVVFLGLQLNCDISVNNLSNCLKFGGYIFRNIQQITAKFYEIRNINDKDIHAQSSVILSDRV